MTQENINDENHLTIATTFSFASQYVFASYQSSTAFPQKKKKASQPAAPGLLKLGRAVHVTVGGSACITNLWSSISLFMVSGGTKQKLSSAG